MRIATRQSPLALWQARHVANMLQKHWPGCKPELVPLVTTGDKFLQTKLLSLGGKGVFVKELEEALLDNRADIAVHSTKDVPALLPEGLLLHTICKRDNPFDMYIAKNHLPLDQLPEKARIGTISLRRQAQLPAYRPDLEMTLLRGNIQTRLEKLQSENLDAIILAASGLERMGLSHLGTHLLTPPMMLPACGQGDLSIECRTDDLATQNLLAPLVDANTSICVRLERALNAKLGGNCHAPFAVFAEIHHNTIHLRAKVLSEDGQQCISFEDKSPVPEAATLLENAAQSLFAQGAGTLLVPH